jgi:serine protease Do
MMLGKWVKEMSFVSWYETGNNSTASKVGYRESFVVILTKFLWPLGLGSDAMRRFWPLRFGYVAISTLTIWLAIVGSVALPAADVPDAAKAPTAAANTQAISQSLRQLLNGASPAGLNDLLAMQQHVQGLSEKLKKCTVGVSVGNAWGSGVIISPDGYVLTAAHVAGQPNKECTFTLSDGREVKGKTLGMFRTQDAGLMKITEPGPYPYAELGDSSGVKERSWCIALGHPGGYQSERGIVLRLGQVLHVSKDAITTWCALVGGDSGGPLFDLEGRVIGINSRIAERLTTNMHVPVNAFQDRGAWDRMVKGDVWGHMPGQTPWLGVQGDEKSREREARIAAVTAKSPAAKYDLKPGDVIIKFDDRDITNFQALTDAVAECHVNESVMLKVRRGDNVVDVRLRLGRREE